MKKWSMSGTTVRFSAAMLIGHLSEKERNLIWLLRGSEGKRLFSTFIRRLFLRIVLGEWPNAHDHASAQQFSGNGVRILPA
jgi:hypothetical protein